MKKILFTVLFTILFASIGFAQSTPRVEASAGFTATHFDRDFNGLNFQGWIGTLNYNAIRGGENTVAVSVEGGGSYFSGLDLYHVHVGAEYSYGEKIRPFGRALFGRTYANFGSYSDDAFSGVIGGGIKVPIAKRFFIRTGADYLFTRFNDATQNAVRVNVGVGFGY